MTLTPFTHDVVRHMRPARPNHGEPLHGNLHTITKKIFMENVFVAHNGCLNLSYDFNLATSGLGKAEYTLVKRPADADTIVFAGCGVGRPGWTMPSIGLMRYWLKMNIIRSSLLVASLPSSRIESERRYVPRPLLSRALKT